MPKTLQIDKPKLLFVHEIDKRPESQLRVFHVIQYGTNDQVHTLNVPYLRVINCVLCKDLSEHFLIVNVRRESGALRMCARKVFLYLS